MSITQEHLKSVLHYCPETGVFTWIKPSAKNIKPGDIAGTPDGGGYRLVCINRQIHKAHRLSFLYMEGEFPNEVVDHINGIADDNSWKNLRAVSHTENCKNAKISVRNTSGIVGVGWNKKGYRWQAYITVNRKMIHLGFFEGFFDACCARKSAELKYGFHKNHGRKI